ncbi:response regulator [Paucibacter sp. B2R-40]|uniref:response regulator transcription factor n=1 Tax=Paucibacter sp. B2R-40 TaxID=2893554 RepID=UPI0021E3769E|nr:response regulator [Paucibacter sp. B2R-40]MCV2356937.1 response regulator [Paucibacter sp. B2R-40]
MNAPQHNAALPTLLIVDDSPDILILMEELLSDQYKILTASGGAQALDIIASSTPPDLILLDCMMPGMDGYETCRKLRSSSASSTPVIFLSALSSIEERLLGYSAGGDDYVCKPFDMPELIAKIERQLAVVSSKRELGNQLNEAVNAVMSSADMVGEVGVVLDFQRALNACTDYASIAARLFEAFERYRLDGCIRIQGKMGAVSLNSKTSCTALELSILDHLAAQKPDPRIRPFGPHTSFNFGSIILFLRDLPMTRSPEMDPELAERYGRAIDNVALLIEGACTKVTALDNELAVRELNSTVIKMVNMTRLALADISAKNKAQSSEVQALFEALAKDVDDSFMNLGLLSQQEEFLSGLIKSYMAAVIQSLAKGRETENRLGKVIEQLGQLK